jgi:dienelactone hydrolase
MTTPNITQAMIDAYDEYTHLTLDRRGFMEKLTALAGSGAAATAIAPLLAANPAAAEIVPADDARLKAEDITWPASTGEMKGYLVRPAEPAGKLPSVIVIHENRGLNAHIRDVARRVALEGFVALAPDYLSPPKDPEQIAKINAALLLHYAGEDARINAGIDAYKAALEAAGKDFTIYVYEGAQHAFNNDTSAARYNKEAADLAWGRTIAFFKEKLG